MCGIVGYVGEGHAKERIIRRSETTGIQRV